MNSKNLTTITLLIIFAGIIALFRMYPISPNFNPLLVFILFLGCTLPARIASISVVLICILADFVSAAMMSYPVFGGWSWFTYSGFFVLAILPQWVNINCKKWHFVFASLSASLGFWMWTNFGVWLTSGIYQHTAPQLAVCYIAALPFLKSSLIAATIFSILLKEISTLTLNLLYPKLKKV